jgi:hypothetical protein
MKRIRSPSAIPQFTADDLSIWMRASGLVANLIVDSRVEERTRQELVLVPEEIFMVLSHVNRLPWGYFVYLEELIFIAHVLSRLFREVPEPVLIDNWFGNPEELARLKVWTSQVQRFLRSPASVLSPSPF